MYNFGKHPKVLFQLQFVFLSYLLPYYLTKIGMGFFKCGLLGIYKHFFFHLTVKFKYCEKDTKFEKFSHSESTYQPKKGGIFPKFLWPSKNI